MLKEKNIEIIKLVAEENEGSLVELNNNTVLLGTGLDSLGFEVLVPRLEYGFGYDPFILNKTDVYPKTLNEFIEYLIGDSALMICYGDVINFDKIIEETTRNNYF